MRGVLIVVVLVAAGCALPVEEKTGCRSSVDCLGDRICVDAECIEGACEQTCEDLCARGNDCNQSVPAGCGDCPREGAVFGFSETDCKQEWDILAFADFECEVPACFSGCHTLCVQAQVCALIVDAAACTLGCQEFADTCPAASVPQCSDIPDAVQCYELGEC